MTPNNQQTIVYAIQSVLNQDYTPLEYIIIDGASTDETIKIIQVYINNDMISQVIDKFSYKNVNIEYETR